MHDTKEYAHHYENAIVSLGSLIPYQLAEETRYAISKLSESLGGDVAGFVANRLQFSPEDLAASLAAEQVYGVAFAIKGAIKHG